MVGLSKAISHRRYKIRPRVQLMTNIGNKMTREEFIGVTFNDLDPPGNRDFKVMGVFRRQ